MGEGHLRIAAGNPADQEPGNAGAQRRLDYWDTGAYLDGQSRVAAAEREAVVALVGIETAVVVV